MGLAIGMDWGVGTRRGGRVTGKGEIARGKLTSYRPPEEAAVEDGRCMGLGEGPGDETWKYMARGLVCLRRRVCRAVSTSRGIKRIFLCRRATGEGVRESRPSLPERLRFNVDIVDSGDEQ